MMRWCGWFFAMALVAQDAALVAPKGWTMERQGSRTVFRPGDLKSGETLAVEVDDPVAAGGDLREWTRARVAPQLADKCPWDVARQGEVSCTVSGAGGVHFHYGVRTKTGHDSFAHVFAGPSAMTAMRYAYAVQGLLDGAAAGKRPAGAPEVLHAPAPVPVTPGFAVPLENLYLHLEYRAGVGGGVYPNYVPYLFLKDGTVTDDLSYYPTSVNDIAAWRRRDPRGWGKWTRSGGVISIQWDDARRKADRWEKWVETRAGAPGKTLTGTYRSISGGGNTALGGDAMVVAWGLYEFFADGTVVVGGGASSSNSTVTTGARRAEQRARYRIDGYTITLTFAGGRSERQWFYLYPDSDGALGIGERVFSQRK